ncbi:hypothetical protein ScPMuIL_004823 [Solemya velum]
MIYTVAVLTLLASSVFCQEAPKCCTVDQWEAKESQVNGIVPTGGQSQIINVGLTLHYDSTNQRVAAEETITTKGQTYDIHVIQDFAKKIQYNIIANNCTKTVIGSFEKACVPDNLDIDQFLCSLLGHDVMPRLMGNYYFGGKAQALPFTAYQMSVQGLQVQVAVTTTGCYPVEEIILGKFGTTDVSETFNYVNITDGIKDPSVFTPPASCNSGPVKYGVHLPTGSRILRGRSFLTL